MKPEGTGQYWPQALTDDMNTILKKFILNFAVSALVCTLSGFAMLAAKIDERFLKDGIAITFFSTVSLFYLATNFHTSDDKLPKLGGLPLKTYCILFAQSVIAFSITVFCVSITDGPAFIPTDYSWRRLSPIIFLIISSIYEEIVFRGYILSSIKNFFNSELSAIAITAVLFSLVHLPGKFGLPELLWHFVFGVLTGILTTRYKSLSPAVIFHFTFNYGIGSSQLAYEVAKLHPGIVHFNSRSPSESFSLFSGIIFLIYAIAFAYHKRKIKLHRQL